MKYYIVVWFFMMGLCMAQTQATAEVTGSVTDPLGVPLPDVTISIENTEFQQLTDFEGVFTIENVPTGNYNITATKEGYQPQTKFNIRIKSAGNAALTFELKESTNTLGDLVIQNINYAQTDETPLSTQAFSAEEIKNYPGTNNDVVSVAQSFPGVSPSFGGFRNDLIIRGGAPNETVYYLDGMEIPNINHFSTQGSAGGPVGMLNVAFIDDVTFSASSFPARYDNPLSGVLQFEQRKGNAERFAGNFRLSASEAGFTAEGPLFKGDKDKSPTTYMLSLRRSYLQFLFKAIGLPIRPDYYDYQWKIDHQIDERNSLSFLGLGSIDNFTLEAPSTFDDIQQAVIDQAPFIEQRTLATGLSWKHRLKNNQGQLLTTFSHNFLKNDYKQYTDGANEEGLYYRNKSTEAETKIRSQLLYKTERIDWQIGTNIIFSDYLNNTIDVFNNQSYNTDINFIKYGWFVQATTSWADGRLTTSLGLRSDDDTHTKDTQIFKTFSPRFALSYRASAKWKINATVGRYFKIPPYTILGYKDANGELTNQDIDYTQSDHIAIGTQYFWRTNAYFSLEAFYKKYSQYPVSIQDGVSLANKGASFEVLGNEPVATVGKGRTYGLEFLFRQRFTKNFYGIFSYTFFYSEFSGLDSDVYLPSVWDSRHLISFTGGYKFNKGWEISSRFRFAGETPYVPIDETASVNTYPDIIYDYSRLGEEKLHAFNQLDVRVAKRWNFNTWAMEVFIETQNLLMANTPQPPGYGLNRDEEGTIIEPRSLVELNDNDGQLIPVIGVVIDF